MLALIALIPELASGYLPLPLLDSIPLRFASEPSPPIPDFKAIFASRDFFPPSKQALMQGRASWEASLEEQASND